MDSLSHFTAKSGTKTQRTRIAVAKLLDDSLDHDGNWWLNEPASASAFSVEARRRSRSSNAQMLRVLGNLIGNCIKYCPQGTSVLLRAEETCEQIEMVVSDNGPGMTLEDQRACVRAGGGRALPAAPGKMAPAWVSRSYEIVVSQNDGTVSLQSQTWPRYRRIGFDCRSPGNRTAVD